MPESNASKINGQPPIDANASPDDLLSSMRSEPTPKSPDVSCPAREHPAIARCYHAYEIALKTYEDRKYDPTRNSAAEQAFRQAMPPLIGKHNIRDFIACVAHAILVRFICSDQGVRLLHAAQIALVTNHARPHRATTGVRSKPPEAP